MSSHPADHWQSTPPRASFFDGNLPKTIANLAFGDWAEVVAPILDFFGLSTTGILWLLSTNVLFPALDGTRLARHFLDASPPLLFPSSGTVLDDQYPEALAEGDYIAYSSQEEASTQQELDDFDERAFLKRVYETAPGGSVWLRPPSATRRSLEGPLSSDVTPGYLVFMVICGSVALVALGSALAVKRRARSKGSTRRASDSAGSTGVGQAGSSRKHASSRGTGQPPRHTDRPDSSETSRNNFRDSDDDDDDDGPPPPPPPGPSNVTWFDNDFVGKALTGISVFCFILGKGLKRSSPDGNSPAALIPTRLANEFNHIRSFHWDTLRGVCRFPEKVSERSPEISSSPQLQHLQDESHCRRHKLLTLREALFKGSQKIRAWALWAVSILALDRIPVAFGRAHANVMLTLNPLLLYLDRTTSKLHTFVNKISRTYGSLRHAVIKSIRTLRWMIWATMWMWYSMAKMALQSLFVVFVAATVVKFVEGLFRELVPAQPQPVVEAGAADPDAALPNAALPGRVDVSPTPLFYAEEGVTSVNNRGVDEAPSPVFREDHFEEGERCAYGHAPLGYDGEGEDIKIVQKVALETSANVVECDEPVPIDVQAEGKEEINIYSPGHVDPEDEEEERGFVYLKERVYASMDWREPVPLVDDSDSEARTRFTDSLGSIDDHDPEADEREFEEALRLDAAIPHTPEMEVNSPVGPLEFIPLGIEASLDASRTDDAEMLAVMQLITQTNWNAHPKEHRARTPMRFSGSVSRPCMVVNTGVQDRVSTVGNTAADLIDEPELEDWYASDSESGSFLTASDQDSAECLKVERMEGAPDRTQVEQNLQLVENPSMIARDVVEAGDVSGSQHPTVVLNAGLPGLAIQEALGHRNKNQASLPSPESRSLDSDANDEETANIVQAADDHSVSECPMEHGQELAESNDAKDSDLSVTHGAPSLIKETPSSSLSRISHPPLSGAELNACESEEILEDFIPTLRDASICSSTLVTTAKATANVEPAELEHSILREEIVESRSSSKPLSYQQHQQPILEEPGTSSRGGTQEVPHELECKQLLDGQEANANECVDRPNLKESIGLEEIITVRLPVVEQEDDLANQHRRLVVEDKDEVESLYESYSDHEPVKYIDETEAEVELEDLESTEALFAESFLHTSPPLPSVNIPSRIPRYRFSNTTNSQPGRGVGRPLSRNAFHLLAGSDGDDSTESEPDLVREQDVASALLCRNTNTTPGPSRASGSNAPLVQTPPQASSRVVPGSPPVIPRGRKMRLKEKMMREEGRRKSTSALVDF